MRAHLTGRTVRVLIGTEPTNLVTRDVSEVKVTWEGFAGDNHEGPTRPADVRVKWFPRGRAHPQHAAGVAGVHRGARAHCRRAGAAAGHAPLLPRGRHLGGGRGE